MDILKVIALGLVGTLLILSVRRYQAEIALLLSLALGIMIFLLISEQVRELLTVFVELAAKSSLKLGYFNILLKILCLSYVTEFVAHICRDAGETAAAVKIELAARVMMLSMSLPIVFLVLEMLSQMMS